MQYVCEATPPCNIVHNHRVTGGELVLLLPVRLGYVMIMLMCATVCLCEQDKDTRDGPCLHCVTIDDIVKVARCRTD